MSGALHAVAGRVLRLENQVDGVHATVKLRGGERVSELLVDTVVNCTGPSTDLRQLDDALIKQMLSDGLIQPDLSG